MQYHAHQAPAYGTCSGRHDPGSKEAAYQMALPLRGMARPARQLVHTAVTSPNHVSNGQAAPW